MKILSRIMPTLLILGLLAPLPADAENAKFRNIYEASLEKIEADHKVAMEAVRGEYGSSLDQLAQRAQDSGSRCFLSKRTGEELEHFLFFSPEKFEFAE